LGGGRVRARWRPAPAGWRPGAGRHRFGSVTLKTSRAGATCIGSGRTSRCHRLDRNAVTDAITIAPSSEHHYAVTLRGAGARSVHQVVVPSHLLADLGLGPDDEIRLVRASFEFLLERESASSILPRLTSM
jgi:hypothetical protein